MQFIKAEPHNTKCPIRTGNVGETGPCQCSDGKARRFKVYVYGFDEVDVVATTSGRAKYAAFKAGKEAGYFRDFHEFLVNSGRTRSVAWDYTS
jgi:hypothetical protein